MTNTTNTNATVNNNSTVKETKGMKRLFENIKAHATDWTNSVKVNAAINDMELSAIKADAKAAGRNIVKPAYYAGKAYGYVSETVKANIEEAIGNNKVVKDVCYSAKVGAETGRYAAREDHEARMANSRAKKACKAAEEMVENFIG